MKLFKVVKSVIQSSCLTLVFAVSAVNASEYLPDGLAPSGADIASVRKGVAPEEVAAAESTSKVVESGTYERDHIFQPPLIPHAIDSMAITAEKNSCLDCHSEEIAPMLGATPVSLTHFFDRDGQETEAVSARYYHCTQCHVVQTDAETFTGNTYAP